MFAPGRDQTSVLPVTNPLTHHCATVSFFFLKVWWHAATIFIYFYINRADIQYFIYTTRRAPLLLSSLLSARQRASSGVPSRDWNPGLPYSKPARQYLSHTAPYLLSLFCRTKLFKIFTGFSRLQFVQTVWMASRLFYSILYKV